MGEMVNWYKELQKHAECGDKLSLDELIAMYYMRCLNRVCALFEYRNLPFPQHELEYRAITTGFAGVVKDAKRGIMTAWGGQSGVTEYTDIFKFFTYAAPTAKGGTVKIGKECVIMRNTEFTTSMQTWLVRYAELFAHNDISLRMALVNSRYQDILKTTDSNKTETLQEWYKGLYEGEMLALIDDTPLSTVLENEGDIKTLDLTRTGEVDFTRFTELENELMRSFYRDLGIRWNKDKKANLVSGEVEQDNMLLEYNVNIMLRSREEFCSEYNRVFSDQPPISVQLTIPLESEEKESGENDDIRFSESDTAE